MDAARGDTLRAVWAREKLIDAWVDALKETDEKNSNDL